jgi:hypothetical protein
MKQAATRAERATIRREKADVEDFDDGAAFAAALSLSVPAAAVSAAKTHRVTHWRGYGFLPGYRPPSVIARDRSEHYYRVFGPRYYGLAWPRFYRGRWNGGGFGPCYTQTPIGPYWNCGQ